MTLATGSRLGSYEILSALGAGGMGEVYRATDTVLKRQVALKVLPPDVAADPERIARFQREAETLAALNHPHIAQIYGLEKSGAVAALVLELVDGPTLADRIAQGPIPLDEALPIARQIAEALEAAHERGIIHRDLKPANVKVRDDGTVKVLDFGLAKALELTGTGSTPESLANSPTITSPAMMTGVGVILGTAAYMSPEQAKGKPAGKRTDIWAFGCVLFEMLSGTRVFRGDDVGETLASILRDEPDWASLPVATPPSIRRLLRRTMEKDRRRRLADAADARLDIDETLGALPDLGIPAEPLSRLAWKRRAWLGVAFLAGAIVAGGLATTRPMQSEPTEAAQPFHFEITTPPDAPIRTSNQPGLSISPDGSTVVYRSQREPFGFLYTRAASQSEALRLQGADDAIGPIFSRDGKWIAYADERDGSLKQISVLGGSPVIICSLEGGQLRGASWASNDSIIFATTRSGGLLRVPAGGGVPERVTSVDRAKGEQHAWPDVLPDGRSVLFTSFISGRAQIAIVTLPGGQVHALMEGAFARFAPTGHLLFVSSRGEFSGQSGVLHAVGFDVSRLEATGRPVPVVEDIGTEGSGAAHFAVADNGTLVYARNSGLGPRRTLVWVDRKGHEESINVTPRAYTYARLSPDGMHVALDSRDEENDIWILHLDRGALQRLTNDPGPNRLPVWTRDGKRLAFTAERDGVESIYWQASDGSGTIERLSRGKQIEGPQAFSPDNTQLVFATPLASPFDLGVMSVGGSADPKILLHGPASESNADLSPDGHWLAYASDESNRSEVYVRPFPNVDSALTQVSTEGGSRPLWSHTGRELFYYVAPDTIMAVSVGPGDPPVFGVPQAIVKGSYAVPFNNGRHYDASPDGQRFLLLKDASTGRGQEPKTPGIHVVLNWFEELKAKVPVP